MITPNDGGPAFPTVGWDDVARQDVQFQGMSLRDWFAGQIASGMAASAYWQENFQNNDQYVEAAIRAAYFAADVAMKVRSK